MTILNAQAPQLAGTAAARRAGLAWTAWRPHRAGITCLLVALGAYAVLSSVTALGLHAQYADYLRQHCATSGSRACAGIVRAIGAYGDVGLAGWELRGLVAVPALIGLLIGAPLVAREFETDTSRFARTQGVGMARQVAAKLLLLGAVVVVTCAPLGLIAAWLSRPLALVYGPSSHWQAQDFNRSAVMLPAWALLACYAGVLAGAVIRRVVPAIAATLAGCVAAAFAVGGLTSRLLTVGRAAARSASSFGIAGNFTGISGNGVPSWIGVPHHRRLTRFVVFPDGQAGPHGSWQVSGWLTGAHGQRLSAQAVAELMRRLPVRVALSEPRLRAWLAARHISYWIGYQPAGRYWLFQAVAAVIVLALAVAAGLIAVRLAGRRT